jgi:hypothetical protein
MPGPARGGQAADQTGIDLAGVYCDARRCEVLSTGGSIVRRLRWGLVRDLHDARRRFGFRGPVQASIL